jgi:hypothetical protein
MVEDLPETMRPCGRIRLGLRIIVQGTHEVSHEMKRYGNPTIPIPFSGLRCLNYFREASRISSVAGKFWARISASPLLSDSR